MMSQCISVSKSGRDWQKELYKNVKKRNVETLLSLDPPIPTPDVLAQLGQEEEPCIGELQELGEREIPAHPTSDVSHFDYGLCIPHLTPSFSEHSDGTQKQNCFPPLPSSEGTRGIGFSHAGEETGPQDNQLRAHNGIKIKMEELCPCSVFGNLELPWMLARREEEDILQSPVLETGCDSWGQQRSQEGTTSGQLSLQNRSTLGIQSRSVPLWSHLREKLFQCRECGKSFPQKSSRVTHCLTHIGE